jgi:hypothetical protein
MRKLLTILALLAPLSAAHAQSQDDIAGKITSTLPDNGRGQITASGLRGVLNAFNNARGVPNGLATLGFDGKLVPSQAPSQTGATQLRVTDQLSVSPTCFSTDGAFAVDGTGAWEPTCFGTFLATNMDIKVYPTRGAGKDLTVSPLPTNFQFTRSLIQGQGNAAVEKEANGQFINWECVGGAVSAAKLNSTNCTGQLISARTRPGPNGERPPTTWGFNVDLALSNTPIQGQAYVSELDLNNYSGHDCYPGQDCLTAGIFLNGIGSYTNTAWIYSGGGNSERRTVGVSVNNNTVTWVSGDQKFRRSIYRLNINGTFYRVNYVNETTLTGVVPIPNAGPESAWWEQAMVANGILFQGENMASDNDIALNTSAYGAVTIAGRHHVALIASEDQKVCLKAFDACWSYSNGGMQYASQGVTPFKIFSVSGGVNGAQVTSAGSGFGPLFEPQGNDVNIPLNLRAKGSAQVQVLSGLTVSPLASAGNRFVCANSAGSLYASATACQ